MSKKHLEKPHLIAVRACITDTDGDTDMDIEPDKCLNIYI